MAALRSLRPSRWQPAHGATVIGFAMVCSGFGVVLLGWRGAAGLVDASAQLPYSASGGLAGLALIGFGAALVNVQVTRRLAARDQALSSKAVDDVTALLVRGRSAADPAPPTGADR